MSINILTAKSAIDQNLIGNPQISFFKIVYRRHTNFSIQQLQIDKQSIDKNGGELDTKIPNSGDLLHKLWIDVIINASNTALPGNSLYFVWTRNTGAALIKDYSLQIGQHIIDKQDSNYLNIIADVEDVNNNSWIPLNKHFLTHKHYYNKENSINHDGNNPDGYLQLYIDIPFWFCKNTGLSLPLISIQNQDIKFKCNIRPIHSLLNASDSSGGSSASYTYGNSKIDLSVMGQFILLDTDERRRYAQTSHEYLIEQLQYSTYDLEHGVTNNLRLNFNHPIKKIYWMTQYNKCNNEAVCTGGQDTNAFYLSETMPMEELDPSKNILLFSNNDYFNYNASNSCNNEYLANVAHYYMYKTANITINSVKLFDPLKASYFEYMTYVHHNMKIPGHGNIFMYSFSLNPTEHQPSGTFNMSNVNNCMLNFYNVNTGSQGDAHVKVYAINYNILRIMSGMAALAYI